VGDLVIGGNNPVVVQEMTSTPTTDIAKTLKQIQALTDVGCRLIRVAVPSEDAAAALQVLKRETDVPLVADIHFDYRLALLSIESGIDKLRINPGNIGSERKVREVVASAREHAIPIRVGVNSGSLQRDLLDTYGGVTAEGLVESALQEVLLLERAGFQWIVISIKAPDIDLTVRANKLLSERVQYPIHIGITESGYAEAGITRSVVGLGTLLLGGRKSSKSSPFPSRKLFRFQKQGISRYAWVGMKGFYPWIFIPIHGTMSPNAWVTGYDASI
jgi:(E)-4-hydroxy-3-methylbut-2-enyl-diphosphate synthase